MAGNGAGRTQLIAQAFAMSTREADCSLSLAPARTTRRLSEALRQKHNSVIVFIGIASI